MSRLAPPPAWSTPREADLFLLGLRWVVIFAGGALFFVHMGDAMRLPFPLCVGLLVAVNLPLSVYCLRRRVFARRIPFPVLIIDAIQAVTVTPVTGGPSSVFSGLFFLLVVELAIALPFRAASICILGAGFLQAVTGAISLPGRWSTIAFYMTFAKLFVLLTIGTLALVFTEQYRRLEKSRSASEEYAQSLTTLNDLFFRMEKPMADVGAILATLVESARRLLKAENGLLLIGEPGNECWTWSEGGVAAPHDALQFSDWGWQIDMKETYIAGPAYRLPVPSLWSAEDIQCVGGVRLGTSAGTRSGALVVARRCGALEDEEWLLLRALSQETEMAFRNARLYAAEHAQVTQLRQFEHARESFFSSIAHELRTPLTVLKTLMPALAGDEGLLPELRGEIRDMVDQNIGRLESLTSDFLESLRLEAGMLTLHRQPLDVAGCVRRTVRALRPLFDARRQCVELEEPDGPLVVNADRRRLDQILSSLLHNACKFTPPGGGIRVTVAAREEGEVRVCVEDDGPGVQAELRERIFDKFSSASTETSAAGLGLGLYICRELVTLHGGRLWYEERAAHSAAAAASPPSTRHGQQAARGGRFCFTLPCAVEGKDGRNDTEDTRH